MVKQDNRFLDKLRQSVSDGYISAPHRLPLPDSFPLSASVCTVRLTEGCRAPLGPMGLRTGCGSGPNDAVSEVLAMAEAVERYSLQYSKWRPQSLMPSITAGGGDEAANVSELCLGHPDSVSNTSRGAAAGAVFCEAVERATLECLESYHVSLTEGLKGSFSKFSLAEIPDLDCYVKFLESQLRTLELYIFDSDLGYSVALAVCRDLDGGRKTFGASANTSKHDAIRKATDEAILLWRNMIELERTAVPISSLQKEHTIQVEIYRGARAFPLPDTFSVAAASNERQPTVPIWEVLSDVTGSRVRVFDMTVKEVGIPVARVLVG